MAFQRWLWSVRAADGSSDAGRLDMVIVWYGPGRHLRVALQDLLGGAAVAHTEPAEVGAMLHLTDVDVGAAREWLRIHARDVEIVSPQWLQEWMDDEAARAARGIDRQPIDGADE